MTAPLSRRDLLEKCAAAGLLLVAPQLQGAGLAALFEEGARALICPTPDSDMGPFYKPGAPRTGTLAPPGAPGQPLGVSGRILDARGAVLAGALVEVWHASDAGTYDNRGYDYRGRLSTGANGAYTFETILPGHYPGRAAQHIHYRVSAPGHRTLVTQLFFATDPVFEGDPDRNYGRDPILGSRELIRPVTFTGEPGAPRALVTFELCLEPA
jgi:protocatechuate 3,4-dioxygenase beta subunit